MVPSLVPFLCELFLPEGVVAPSSEDSSVLLPLRVFFLPELLLVSSDGDSPLVPSVVSLPLWRDEAGDGLDLAPRPPDLGEALAVADALDSALALGEALTEAFGDADALTPGEALAPV